METSRRFFILLKWKRRAPIAPRFERECVARAANLVRIFQIATAMFQERKSVTAHCKPWRGGKRRLLSMDILASMLAYLVSVAGIIGALAISFVVYFSPPDQQPPMPANVVAAAKPPLFDMAASAEIKGLKQTDLRAASKAERAKPASPTVAFDAQQKPQTSPAQLRWLADKERAKRFAERANTDFETRFLHYDD
jgi:hypothetical protein